MSPSPSIYQGLISNAKEIFVFVQHVDWHHPIVNSRPVIYIPNTNNTSQWSEGGDMTSKMRRILVPDQSWILRLRSEILDSMKATKEEYPQACSLHIHSRL
jgi:hypothetical protein